MKLKIINGLIVSCVIVALISIAMLGFYRLRLHRDQKEFGELNEVMKKGIESVVKSTQEEPTGADGDLSDDSIGISEEEGKADEAWLDRKAMSAEELILEGLLQLKEDNEDLLGWLYMDGTNISYPVMHTPNDQEYYLRRNYQKKYSISGTPFLDGRNKVNGDHGNLIVYGHNMKDGSMFGALENYKEMDYQEAHSSISLFTFDQVYEYEIVAAFHTKVYDKQYFDLFSYTQFENKEKANEFIDYIHSKSIVGDELTLSTDDRFITLSTCAYHVENGRYVVVGRLKTTYDT